MLHLIPPFEVYTVFVVFIKTFAVLSEWPYLKLVDELESEHITIIKGLSSSTHCNAFKKYKMILHH